MPQLSKDHKKLDISAERKAKSKSEESPSEDKIKSSTKKPQKPPQKAPLLDTRDDFDDDDDLDEDDSDDEIIASSSKKKSAASQDKTIKFVLLGVGVVAVVVILFLIFGRSKSSEEPTNDPNFTPGVESEQGTGEDAPPPEVPDDENIGIQDFTTDENNTSDSPLTDPEDFTKDLYGLTLRVDYTVSKIQTASDFVNYKKCRGTWGGGLELYYLDVDYKGNKYVIQVPFKYYKELEETGIIPVKMEVLRVKSETDDSYLSVISYMSLDEKTLSQVMKSQS